MDEEKETTGAKEDVKSSPDTTVADKPSSQKPEFTKEQEAEVQKRVSDLRAERGEKVPKLEERIKTLEEDNATLRDKNLKVIADRYELDVEELKKLGIDNSESVAKFAQLFGKKEKDELKDDEKPDSGATLGGGTDWEKTRAAFIKNPSNPKVFKRYMEEKEKQDN